MFGNLYQNKWDVWEELWISLTKETENGTCAKTTYEILNELAEKWKSFSDIEDVYYQERLFKAY